MPSRSGNPTTPGSPTCAKKASIHSSPNQETGRPRKDEKKISSSRVLFGAGNLRRQKPGRKYKKNTTGCAFSSGRVGGHWEGGRPRALPGGFNDSSLQKGTRSHKKMPDQSPSVFRAFSRLFAGQPLWILPGCCDDSRSDLIYTVQSSTLTRLEFVLRCSAEDNCLP